MNDEETKPLLEERGIVRDATLGSEGTPEDTPDDKWNLAYIIFFVLGIGMLFPWNMFITASSFFNDRLAGISLATYSESFFSFGFQIANIGCLFIALRFQHLVSIKKRVVIPLVLQIIAFAVMTALAAISSIGPYAVFGISMICCIIAGASTAFLQGGVFGLAGTLPFKYTQGIMGGQALGGVIVSIANILSLQASTPSASATAYFASSVVVLIACLASFFMLPALPIVRRAFALADQGTTSETPRDFEFKKVWNVVRYYGLSVCYNFFITLSMFPAITASAFLASDPDSKLFVPVYCFLGFNLGDYIGRTLAGFVPRLVSPRHFWIIIALRTVFIPLFLLCNLHKTVLPVVFSMGVYPIVFMVIFAISNGFMGSLCMMYGPLEAKEKERESAGTMMVTCLVSGITLGSFTSFAFVYLVTRQNPFAG